MTEHSSRRKSAHQLSEKHRQSGLVSEDDHVRMVIALNLSRSYMQLSTQADAFHRQFGWSHAGFRLLNFLWGEGDLEIRDLAERTWSTRAAVSSAVNKLEQSGLVRRVPVPTDRRLVTVTLTERGRERLETAIRGQGELEREWLSSLDSGQQLQLASLLQTIADDRDL